MIKKTFKTFAISVLAVWLPWVLWTTIKTYLLDDPDSKFGAEGGVIFVAAIWGLAAVVSGVAAVLILLLTTRITKIISRARPNLIALGCGCLLSFLAYFIPRLPALSNSWYGDIAGMVLSWLLISSIVFMIGYLIDYWTQPNKSLKPDAQKRAS